MGSAKTLSELEGAVLGVLLVRGPVTPYAVRAEFDRSRSSHWSASTGAIYPVIRRLERHGLITTERRMHGRRASTRCRLHPTGRRALRRWIGPPLPEWAAAATFDPVRTRISFLAALPPRARIHLLRDAEVRIASELVAVRRLMRQQDLTGNRWEALATLGAVYEMKMRLAWVRTVMKAVGTRTRPRS
jgi:DNA-binding PadR family transcriptional regulator